MSALCFHKLLMCLTQIHNRGHTHTHTGVAEVSRVVCRVNPCPFSPLCVNAAATGGPLAETCAYSERFLFTGINAFYTQASVGTLSRGLLPAGTCKGSLGMLLLLLLPLCCRWLVGTFEEMLDSTLFGRKSTLVHISKSRRLEDFYNVLATLSGERGERTHSCSNEGKPEQCPGARSGY